MAIRAGITQRDLALSESATSGGRHHAERNDSSLFFGDCRRGKRRRGVERGPCRRPAAGSPVRAGPPAVDRRFPRPPEARGRGTHRVFRRSDCRRDGSGRHRQVGRVCPRPPLPAGRQSNTSCKPFAVDSGMGIAQPLDTRQRHCLHYVVFRNGEKSQSTPRFPFPLFARQGRSLRRES